MGMWLSPEELAKLEADGRIVDQVRPGPRKQYVVPEQPRKPGRAVHKPGEMNKTEAAYAAHLETRKIAGEVAWYRFEGVRLKLADRTTFTPDFLVELANGELEAHDVKGHVEDDFMVKVKVAAEMYPFRFLLVRKKKGGWEYENIGGK